MVDTFGQKFLDDHRKAYAGDLGESIGGALFDKLLEDLDKYHKKFYTENKKFIDNYDKFTNNTNPYKLEFSKANALNNHIGMHFA